MTRNVVAVAIAAVALSACLDSDPVGPQCSTIPFEIATTQGDTITTESGLRYIEATVGTGAAVESCQLVSVEYAGYLEDGTLFDSGPLTFMPGRDGLIPGFAQGVITAKVGGTRRLIIPPALAYGSQPRLDRAGEVIIPANSTLIFDVEIIGVGD